MKKLQTHMEKSDQKADGSRCKVVYLKVLEKGVANESAEKEVHGHFR